MKSESLGRDRNVTLVVIGIHVFMTLMLCSLFTALTGMPLVGVPLGIIIWAMVLFMTPVFNWSFFNAKPNWALVVGSQIVYDKVPDKLSERVKMFDLASMREVGPGLRGRKPGEVVYDSVDLQSELIIGSRGVGGSLLRCYTEDNIPLDIEWQDILTPLRGCLVNLSRKSEDAAVAFFRGEFEQFIIHLVKGKPESDVFSALDDLKNEFKNIFGGPDVVHGKEEEYGLFTNTPQIIKINRSDRYQSAAEGVMIGEKTHLTIDKIHEGFDPDSRPDPNMVLATAASMAGVEVKGLVLIPGTGASKETKNTVGAVVVGQKVEENLRKGGKP